MIEEVGDGYDYVDLPEGKRPRPQLLRMMAFPDAIGDTKVGKLVGWRAQSCPARAAAPTRR
ncbi:MAG: hypothetical protein WKF78_04560 [Candidatus Limnocylindrales bacterium]